MSLRDGRRTSTRLSYYNNPHPVRIIPARAGESQQFALPSDAELRMGRLNQCPPLGQRETPFFRSQSTSTLSWPISW
jgi:hypothetical protein